MIKYVLVFLLDMSGSTLSILQDFAFLCRWTHKNIDFLAWGTHIAIDYPKTTLVNKALIKIQCNCICGLKINRESLLTLSFSCIKQVKTIVLNVDITELDDVTNVNLSSIDFAENIWIDVCGFLERGHRKTVAFLLPKSAHNLHIGKYECYPYLYGSH